MLGADPLADIHNIRQVHSVMQGGKIVDIARLPERRVLSVKPGPAEGKVETATKGTGS